MPRKKRRGQISSNLVDPNSTGSNQIDPNSTGSNPNVTQNFNYGSSTTGANNSEPPTTLLGKFWMFVKKNDPKKVLAVDYSDTDIGPETASSIMQILDYEASSSTYCENPLPLSAVPCSDDMTHSVHYYQCNEQKITITDPIYKTTKQFCPDPKFTVIEKTAAPLLAVVFLYFCLPRCLSRCRRSSLINENDVEVLEAPRP